MGKFIYEVEAMPSSELSEWIAFLQVEKEDDDKRELSASAQNGASKRARKALRK